MICFSCFIEVLVVFDIGSIGSTGIIVLASESPVRLPEY